MKDLKHYFNSPPLEEKLGDNTNSPDGESNNSCKKRKRAIKQKKKNNLSFNLIKKNEESSQTSKENCLENAVENCTSLLSKTRKHTNSSVTCGKLLLDEDIEIDNVPSNLKNSERYLAEDLLDSNSCCKKKKRKRKNSDSDWESVKRVKSKDEYIAIKNDKVSKIVAASNGSAMKEFIGIKLRKVKNLLDDSSNNYIINNGNSLIAKKIETSNKSELDEVNIFKTDGSRYFKNNKMKKENSNDKNFEKKNTIFDDSVDEGKWSPNNNKNSSKKNSKINNSNQFESRSNFEDIVKPVLSNNTNKEENVKRNSLFKYYTKVDKETFQTSVKNDKIIVQAIVHAHPEDTASKLCSNSGKKLVNKSSKKSVKQQSKNSFVGVDEIIVLSSEIITISDDNENSDKVDDSVKSVNEKSLEMTKNISSSNKGNSWKMRVSLGLNSPNMTVDTGEILEIDSEDDCLDNEKKVKSKIINGRLVYSSSKNLKNNLSLQKSVVANGVDKEVDVVQDGKKSVNTTLISGKNKTKNNSNIANGISYGKNRKTKKSLASKYQDIDDSKENKINSRLPSNLLNNSNRKSSTSCANLMERFLGISSKMSPKSSIDPAILAARQKFLESGVPEGLKQKIDNLQSEKQFMLPAPFPKVSHVQQRNQDCIMWNLPDPKITLLPSLDLDLSTLNCKWTTINNNCEISDTSSVIEHLKTPIVSVNDHKKVLKTLTKNTVLDNIADYWSSIKEMKAAKDSKFGAWSEVYKPKISKDLIYNYDSIQKLKSWMEVLKSKRLDMKVDYSSGDEFVDSDSSNKSTSSFGSTCIISGPNGCGKTSAVYAIANELGYKVFEVNASSNRNGKKILDDLSEATQSHQVEHSKASANFFKSGNSRSKKKKLKEEEKKSVSKKRSLILIEDADLLFKDKDEGFITAVASLASSSKRPLVLIVNDNKASHLPKLFKLNQLKLNFSRPSASKLELWLQLVSLANGIKLTNEGAEKLVQWSDCDVRKSLLQLQLLIQSHEKSLKCWPGINNSPTWISSVSTSINDNKLSKINDKETKAIIKQQLKSTARLSQSIVSYDLLASTSYSCSKKLTDSCPVPCKILPAASLFDICDSCNDSNLSSDIADYLYGSVATCVTSQLRNQNQARKTDQTLMSALPLHLHCSHDAVYVDYLPMLRLVGRYETFRFASNTKRTNRFFSYLNGLGVNASSSCIKYMCDTLS